MTTVGRAPAPDHDLGPGMPPPPAGRAAAPPEGRAIPTRTPAAVPAVVRGRRTRVVATFVVLAVGLAVTSVVSAGVGQLQIPPAEVLGSILHRLGLDLGPMPTHAFGDEALWQVRFPRIAMAMITGAALAGAGAVMQGIFGNPLAEPGVVGVSSGAAVGASVVIVFQLSFLGAWSVAAFAFVGGLVTTLGVYLLSRSGGQAEVVTLVLTGIAVNAVGGAAIAFLLFLGDTQAREEIVFWQLGSLNATRWVQVAVVAPLAVAGLVGTMLIARRLDLLALGERSARHLGVEVERTRLVGIVLVALLTAAAVSFAGIIGFVGLVVPHLIRLVVGPSHRVLVAASVLGGALLLALADLGARTLVVGADLPIGMLTALVGGPFFLVLLRRARAKAGGWA